MKLTTANPFSFSSSVEPVAGSIDVRTAADADFAYARFSPTTSYFNGNTMYPTDTTTRDTVNTVRWQLNIPKDATILSATITLYEAQNATWSTPGDDMTFGFEQTDNAAQIPDNSTALSRHNNYGTTDTVSLSGSFLLNDPHAISIDPTMIQELVNRAGWVSGNYIMLWIDNPTNGNTHNQQLKAHGTNSSSVTPRLQVEYEYIP